MKLTRRELAAAALVPAAVATPQQPTAPADEFQAARERVRSTANALNSVALPMATEPATVFRVV
jgi:hypothetical protein